MNIVSYLAPKNRNNSIFFCTQTAKECSKSKNLLVSIVAARIFAALTPIAAFAYGIHAIGRGLTHLIVSKINPKWAAEHINSWEEMRTGLKGFAITALSIVYVAGAILIGARAINKAPSPIFETTYERNRKNCIEMAKHKGFHHIICHEGILIHRPSIPFISFNLDDETVEILWETYELAIEMGDTEAIAAIRETVRKTHSRSEHQGWVVLNAITRRDKPKNALDITIQEIKANLEPQYNYAYSKDEVIKYLSKNYSEKTILDIIDFYTGAGNAPISTRQLHAILIGLQANLTKDDVKPLTIEKLKEMRKPLVAPTVYYSDLHYVQLKKDMYFLHYLEYVRFYRPVENDVSNMRNFRDYGFAEFLARFIAYPLFGTAESNWSYDVADKRIPQYVKGTLFTCYYANQEVIMSIEDQVSAPGLKMIEVYDVHGRFGATVFRGTSDFAGVKRDFELAGVGKTSFEENRQRMIEAFAKPKPQQWHITGHSLGAADAQRLLHTLVTNNERVLLPDLHLWTFNSPRLEHDVEDQFIAATKNNKNISIHHTRTLGDRVQFPGKVLLGDTATDETMNISIADVVVPLRVNSWKELHTASVYSTYAEPDGEINTCRVTNFKSTNPNEVAARSFKQTETDDLSDNPALV